MTAKQKLFIAGASIFVLLAIGVVITKLTISDLAPVNVNFKSMAAQAVYETFENPFERIALYLGKSKIISATPTSVEIQSFTLFRIPLGVLRGEPHMKLSVMFNLAGDDYSSSIIDY